MKGGLQFDDSLKLKGSLDLQLFGKVNPYFDLLEKKNAKKLISGGISSSDIEKFEFLNSAQQRSTIDYTIQKANPVEGKSGYFFWNLPELRKGFSSWNMTYLNSERIASLEVPFLLSEHLELEIAIPEYVAFVTPNVRIEKNSELADLLIEMEVTGKQLIVIRSLEVKSKTVSPGQYKEFKEIIDLWNDQNYRKLIFRE